MSGNTWLIWAAVLLAGAGAFLLLPHRLGTTKPRVAHIAGALLVAAGVVLLSLLWVPAAHFLTWVFFYAFGVAALGGAVGTVTSRDPVYNALSFAVVLLASAGLFLLVGAQFLAAGTVIVYAGAIVVTFLFVIMLAQAEGQALYDRMARSPIQTTIVAFLLLLGLTLAIDRVGRAASTTTMGETEVPALPRAEDLAQQARLAGNLALASVVERAISPTARMPVVDSEAAAAGVPPPHVAGLGGAIYTDHLFTVEVAGAILFVALVGAALIATPRPVARRDRGGGAGIGA